MFIYSLCVTSVCYSQLVKRNVMENVVPIVIATKHLFEKEHHPLLRELLLCLKELMQVSGYISLLTHSHTDGHAHTYTQTDTHTHINTHMGMCEHMHVPTAIYVHVLQVNVLKVVHVV